MLSCDNGGGYNSGCTYTDCTQFCRRDRLTSYHCAVCATGCCTFLTCFDFCGTLKVPCGRLFCSKLLDRVATDDDWDAYRAKQRDAAKAAYDARKTSSSAAGTQFRVVPAALPLQIRR